MASSIQLCLVNNDPTATLLVTTDGEPLFSVETPPVPHAHPIDLHARGVPRPKGATTKIKRLERYHMSTGHVETEIGVIEYKGPVSGTHLQLCEEGRQLEIAPRKALKDIEEAQDYEPDENSWEFSGSDCKRYKWQMFAYSPILLLADNSLTPLARYRRAKVGIVSRSRRAFLEILPAGINIIDLIVVTFVAFMKQRLLIDDSPPSTSSSSTPPSPMTPPTPVTPPTQPSRPQSTMHPKPHKILASRP